jgi:hypothetical protein
VLWPADRIHDRHESLGCYCKGIENHLHVYLFKGSPAEDISPLDPSPFLPHGSNEPPSAHDLPKAGQHAGKCSSTSHAVEFRVPFDMQFTESKQTIYRQAVANTAVVGRDEISISNPAMLEEGDELSEPARRVAGNESVEFDTIVAAANNRHFPSPPSNAAAASSSSSSSSLLFFLLLPSRLLQTGGVNSPQCSALPRADETLTYYSAGSCRSHAQEMARRLSEDTINQELMRLGLPNTTIIKAPSVAVSGGRSSSDKVLVAGIVCATIATLLLFVCVFGYCWKKKKDRQQVEMQQGAGNVNPAPAETPWAAVTPSGGAGVPGGGAAVGGGGGEGLGQGWQPSVLRGHRGVGYNV